jgi:exoribonuclease R
MLPRQLLKICSLDEGEERLAFSIFVVMSRSGQVIGESRIEKNILKSRFKLSYDIVQNIITGKTTFSEFSKHYDCSEEEFESLI